MKSTTSQILALVATLTLTRAAPQAAQSDIDPLLSLGFNSAAAAYYATAIADPAISSAFDAAAAIVTAESSQIDAIAPTDANGDYDPLIFLTILDPAVTGLPSAEAAEVTSVVGVVASLQKGASAGASSIAAAGSSVASTAKVAESSVAASVSSAASSLAHAASSQASSAGAAASSAASASAASATPSKAAAAPQQTMAVGLMGAMLAGVAGLAVAL